MISANDISTIMPVYNCERYITEAIESIRSQSLLGSCEIIVVDDGSSDSSAEIAESLEAKVLRQNHKHAAAARNLGIKAVTRPWVFFLDSDDVLRKTAFEAYARTLEDDPDLHAILSRVEDFVSPELKDAGEQLPIGRPEPYSGPISGATFVKMSVFDKIGFFDESLSSGEGVDWLMRLKNSDITFQNIPNVTMSRRLHLTNTGRIHKDQEARNIAAILRKKLAQNS